MFSGDTLFQGGPGATGRSFSDFPTILGSIKDKLGKLPADTVVYTGHGDTTRIGDELVQLRRVGGQGQLALRLTARGPALRPGLEAVESRHEATAAVGEAITAVLVSDGSKLA